MDDQQYRPDPQDGPDPQPAHDGHDPQYGPDPQPGTDPQRAPDRQQRLDRQQVLDRSPGYDPARWGRHLTALGYDGVEPLGSGVEGAAWRLGEGLVAKIWYRRPVGELLRLGTFLDDVAHAGLPFGVPRFLSVDLGPAELAWTLEPELDGRPLAPDIAGRSPQLTRPFVETLLEVHGALAEVVPSPGLRLLPALGEERPLLAGHGGFPAALAALVERRLARSAAIIGPAVPNLAAVAAAVTERLRALEDAPEGLVHGDLSAANILIDESRTPTAVLDFGLLSAVGDPAFDAAVTAGITDRDGPLAAANRARLDEEMTDRFAYEPERLALYRLAHALVTAAWYDPTGRDGHTRWAAEIIAGSDAALALS